jgi:hypothetical protein
MTEMGDEPSNWEAALQLTEDAVAISVYELAGACLYAGNLASPMYM